MKHSSPSMYSFVGRGLRMARRFGLVGLVVALAASAFAQAPTFTSANAATFTTGQANSFTLTATGTTPITFGVNPSYPLPSWASLDSATGILTGNPTDLSGSPFTFIFQATNSVTTTPWVFTLTVVSSNPLPTFVTNPVQSTVQVGQPASFGATATGTPSPTYRWQRLAYGSTGGFVDLSDDLTYSGTTTAVLSILTTTTIMNGDQFRVVATNTTGSVASSAATLVVNSTAPSITSQPASLAVANGLGATFAATATGLPVPTVRWQRQAYGTTGFANLADDSVFSGTATAILTISAVTPGMSGDTFRLVATNDAGTASSNGAILTVNSGVVISSWVGTPGFPGILDGSLAGAGFNAPPSIAMDLSGNVFVADQGNSLIRKVTPAGVASTVAGLAGARGSLDGLSTSARFNGPGAVAVDAVGILYVADTLNHTIRVITTSGTVTTLAGLAGAPGSTNGAGSAARFSQPSGIAVDFSGTVYVADTGNHVIRKISSGVVTTFAGTVGTPGLLDGTGTAALFRAPAGLAIDQGGNLYVADSQNNVIRRITSGGVVTTVAGSPTGVAGSANGTGTAALFSRPLGVAVDNVANIYVADAGNHLIRKILPTTEVSTLAGSVVGSQDGVSTAARFNTPSSVAVDATGNVYIADTGNNVIRRTTAGSAVQVTTAPVAASAVPGDNVTFSVVATGSPLPSAYQWQRKAAGAADFENLGASATYGGVTTSTLTVRNVSIAMNSDQFRVVVANGVGTPATSAAAALTTGALPVFTSADATSFRAQVPGTFTVTATSPRSIAYSVTGLPSWASFNATTGVLSGTAPDTTGSPFTLTFKANSGLEATQTFTLTVLPPNLPPTISGQPTGVALNLGQSATLSVTAEGTAPLGYQWRRNGILVAGGTSASLTLSGVQAGSAGAYTVTVTNAFGTAVSTAANVAVNTPPVIALQPGPQATVAGGAANYSVVATGALPLSYQWRRNGANIAGATASALALTNLTAADAGNIDVVVANAFGSVRSSLAQLTIAAGPTAPVITAQPSARSVLAGYGVSMSVAASGVPAPTYQWRKNGTNVSGATAATLALGAAQAADAGSYDVVVTNSAGSVTSAAAALRVFPRSFAGTYFGSFGGGAGSYALLVRDDNTAALLAFLPGVSAAVSATDLVLTDGGQFNVTQPAAGSVGAFIISGNIASDGAISGTVSGAVTAAVTGTQAADTAATQNIAGYYSAGASTGAATVQAIVGANGQSFILLQSGATVDGGVGTASNSGQITLATNRSSVTGLVNASTGLITLSSTGAITASFAGGSSSATALQRLGNISTRSRVGTLDAVTIVGFVISGEVSKPVLIRAVGPTLGAAPFNVITALATPKLELFRGTTSLQVNTGIAANRAAVDAAAQQSGAFPLAAAGTDAAIVTTLAPGNYTAVVSSTTSASGVALVEVYDLSTPTPGQKLLNLSTRATAGAGEDILVAGFVVPPGTTKRVLVRAVGPGLAAFGVAGVLAQPTLTLLSGTTSVATNTNWSTSVDAAAITAASARVGAFSLGNNDSAIVMTLAPGNYTAQVAGPAGSTGIALLEVFELP